MGRFLEMTSNSYRFLLVYTFLRKLDIICWMQQLSLSIHPHSFVRRSSRLQKNPSSSSSQTLSNNPTTAYAKQMWKACVFSSPDVTALLCGIVVGIYLGGRAARASLHKSPISKYDVIVHHSWNINSSTRRRSQITQT